MTKKYQPEPELVKASELAGLQLARFIDWVRQVSPELTQTEATYLATTILKQLPQVLGSYPVVLTQIRQQAQQIISQRK